MANDATRNVKIDISVVSNAAEKFAGIATNLQKLATALAPIAESIGKVSGDLTAFGTALAPLKSFSAPEFTTFSKDIKKLSELDPSKLASFSEAIKGFQNIKISATFKTLAETLTVVSNIKSLVDINPFVTSVQTLSSVKGLPVVTLTNLSTALLAFQNVKGLGAANLTSFATALLKLKDVKGIPVATLTKVASMLFNFTGIGKDLPDGTKLTKFAKGLKALKGFKLPDGKSMVELLTALKAFSGIGKLPTFDKFASSITKLAKADTSTFGKLAADIKELAKSMASLTNTAPAVANLQKVSTQAVQTSKSVDKLGKTAKTTGSAYENFMNKLRNYSVYRVIADSVIGLKEALTAGFQEIVAYDQALKDLQAITTATSQEVENMGKTILEVASTTKFSGKEVAEGMRTLGQAGFSAQQAIQAMQGVADLATGTLSSMSESVDLVTSAIRVFGEENLTASHAADVFANSVNKSKLTLDKLRTSFNYVGPIAKSAGVSFEDMSTAMAVLANSGLRASKIGTGLRRVLAELVDPNKKLAAAAREAGISLEQLNPEGKSLEAVLEALSIVVTDSQAAFDLFGKRGAAAALTLTQNLEQYKQLSTEIGKDGTAATMAATQMEGLGVSFKNLKDKLGVLMIALGDAGITMLLRTFVAVMRELVDAVTDFVNSPIGKVVVFMTTLGTVIVVANIAVAAFLALMSSGIAVITGVAAATTADTVATNVNTAAKVANTAARGAVAAAAGAETAANIASAASAGAAVGRISKLGGTLARIGPLMLHPVTLVITAIGALGAIAYSSAKDSEELVQSFNRMSGAIDKTISNLKKYKESLVKIEVSDKDNIEKLEERRALVDELANAYPKYTEEILKAADSYSELNSVIQKIQNNEEEEGNKKRVEGMRDLSVAAAQYEEQRRNEGSIFNKVRTWITDENAALLHNNEVRGKVLNTTRKFAEEQLKLNKDASVDDIAEAWKETADQTGVYYKTVLRLEPELRKAAEYVIELSNNAAILQDIGIFSDWASEFEEESVKFVGEMKGLEGIVANSSEEMKKLLGGIYTEEEIARERGIQARRAELVKQREELEKNLQIASNSEDSGEVKRLIAQREVLNATLTSLNKEQLDDYTLIAGKRLIVAKNSYDKELELLKEQRKIDLITLAEFESRKIQIKKTFENEQKATALQLFDPGRTINDTKETIGQLELEYAKLYATLEGQVLHKQITEEQAAQERRALELELSNEILALWTSASESINLVAGDSKEAKKARAEKLEAEKDVVEQTIEVAREGQAAQIEAAKNAAEKINKERLLAEKLYYEQQEQLVAKGLLSDEKAELNKLQYTVNRLSNQYLRAKKTAEEIAELDGGKASEEAQMKAAEAFTKLEEGKTKLLEYHTDYRNKLYKQEYEASISSMETSLKDFYLKMEQLRAVDALTHEEVEQAKLASSLAFYEDSLTKAEEYFDAISQKNLPGSAAYKDAQEEMIEAKNKFLEVSAKALESANDDEEKAAEKLKELGEEVADEAEKNLDKRTDAEEDFNKKRQKLATDTKKKLADIESSLQQKLKELDEERIDAAQDTASDIQSIYTKAEDSIRTIRQRGMTDEQKQADDLSAMYRKLQLGKEAVSRGKSSGDESEVARGQKLLEQALGLAEGLDDQGDAIDGVRKATDELAKAREAENVLENLEIEKNKTEEIAEATKKRKEAEEASTIKLGELKEKYDDILEAEVKRHTEEMSNLAKEVEEWQKKLDLAKKLQEITLSYTKEEGTNTGTQIKDQQAPQASNASFKTSVQDYSEAEAQIREIQEKGFRAIEEAGKTIYTNLTDAQREAMDLMVQAMNDSEDKPVIDFEAGTESLQISISEALESVAIPDIKPKVDPSSIEDATALLDDMDGKVTYSTHYVKTINTALASTGGLISELAGGVIQGFSAGGAVFKKLANRFISAGSGFKDDVPALLKKKEFVQSEPATSYYGVDFMKALNARLIPKALLQGIFPSFDTGGLVQEALSGISSGSTQSSSSAKSAFNQVVQFDITPNRPNVEASISSSNLEELLHQFDQMRKFGS